MIYDRALLDKLDEFIQEARTNSSDNDTFEDGPHGRAMCAGEIIAYTRVILWLKNRDFCI